MNRYVATIAAGMLLIATGCGRKPDAAPEPVAAPADTTEYSAPPAGLEWGDWTVVGHRMPGVGAMSVNEALDWRGRVAHYDSELAAFGSDSCPKPAYRSQDVRGDSLLSVHYGVGPLAFGLAPGGTITMIEVRRGDSLWNAPGNTLLRMPDGAMFTVWDGTFFELKRR